MKLDSELYQKTLTRICWLLGIAVGVLVLLNLIVVANYLSPEGENSLTPAGASANW